MLVQTAPSAHLAQPDLQRARIAEHLHDAELTPAERQLFMALRERGVRFLIVGLGAAVLEGAPVATQDIDLWFESVHDDRIALAARDAGSFWISGFGVQRAALDVSPGRVPAPT